MKRGSDLRVNFGILDTKTDQVIFRVKNMKAKDFLDNWSVFRGKLE